MSGGRRGRATREAILAAAGRLFAERGYAGTTMDAIAAAAGVTKATLYRHVRGKEALRDLLASDLPGVAMEARDARAAILEAAMSLVAAQGFARTTLDEIAAVAGVSRGAIYWHFAGKSELIAALIQSYTPFPRVAAILESAGDQPFSAIAPQIYAAASAVLGERSDFLRAALPEVQINPELASVMIANVFTPILQPLVTLLQRDIDLRLLKPVDPFLAIQALIGPLLFHLFTRDVLDSRIGTRHSLAQAQATFLRIYLDGLRADPPPLEGASEKE